MGSFSVCLLSFKFFLIFKISFFPFLSNSSVFLVSFFIIIKTTSMGSHPLLMSKSATVNENTLLLLVNQYVFISSTNAFLKMFWLFECWLIIYLLMHNECWDFNMFTLFQQIRSNYPTYYIFNWLIINFLLCFILSWTIIQYYFVFCVWKKILL